MCKRIIVTLANRVEYQSSQSNNSCEYLRELLSLSPFPHSPMIKGGDRRTDGRWLLGKECEIAVFSLKPAGFGHFSAMSAATGLRKNIPLVELNSVLG